MIQKWLFVAVVVCSILNKQANQEDSKLVQQKHIRQKSSPREPPSITLKGFLRDRQDQIVTDVNYDPRELFKNFGFISSEDNKGLLDEYHTPELFDGLTYHHWKTLVLFISGKTESYRFLFDWDEIRVSSFMELITVGDLNMITKSCDGAFFFGLLFRYISPSIIEAADIGGHAMMDFLCMLGRKPFTNDQQYDLGYLIENFSKDWLQKHRWIIGTKIGYAVNFAGPAPRLSLVNNGKNFGEEFFIDTGIICSPFTVEDFKSRSKLFFAGITADRLESFLQWVEGVPEGEKILKNLERHELKEITTDRDLCLVVANVLDSIDVYNLPLTLGPEQSKALLSRIDWRNPDYRNLAILKRLNPLWKDKFKEVLIPKCYDHFPRSTRMVPRIAKAENILEINQAEVEDYFIKTGTIMDGIAPFTCDEFGNRRPDLLMNASLKGTNNFAIWIQLGDFKRAEKIVATLTTDDILSFDRAGQIHLFSQVFPLFNMDAMISANLPTSSMMRLLNSIAETGASYKFDWSILEKLPNAFFENFSYASAVLQIVCKKLQFYQMPASVLEVLNSIYGDRIGKRQSNLATVAKDLIDEEQQGRFQSIERGIQRIMQEDPTLSYNIFFELESTKEKVKVAREAFLDHCFEIEMAQRDEIDDIMTKLRESRDHYIKSIDGFSKVHAKLIKSKK